MSAAVTVSIRIRCDDPKAFQAAESFAIGLKDNAEASEVEGTVRTDIVRTELGGLRVTTQQTERVGFDPTCT